MPWVNIYSVLVKFPPGSAPPSQHSSARESQRSPSHGLQGSNNAPSCRIQHNNSSLSRSVKRNNSSPTCGLRCSSMSRGSIQQRSLSPTKRISVRYVSVIKLNFSLLLLVIMIACFWTLWG